MNLAVKDNLDRQAELVALARLVIYARESARSLNSKDVEEGLAGTLEAITRELDDSFQRAAARKNLRVTSGRYQ